MASRFFATGSSDSESESSEDELIPQSKPTSQAVKIFFSDSEEDTKRVVRSAKSKRHDEIMDIITKIRNQKKVRDISNIQTSFEELLRIYQKAKNVLQTGENAPRFYIRCLVELEEFVNESWEDKKKLSKLNAKALSTLRQKLRKNNREFEEQIAAYKANPDAEKSDGDDDKDGSSSESDDEFDGPIPAADFLKKAAPSVKPSLPEGSADESDDDYWGSSSDSSSSDSELEGGTGTLTAAHFLKRTKDQDSGKAASKREKKEKKEGKRIKEAEENEIDEGWEEVKRGIPRSSEKPKMFGKDVEITHEVILKKLMEIISARGKRGTDRNEQIELLKELRSIASQQNLGPAVDLKILFNIIAAVFDYNPTIASCMKTEMWERCLKFIKEALHIVSNTVDVLRVADSVADDAEKYDEPPYQIRACILTVVEKMDEEYTKILQATDAHSTEYVDRLKDEMMVTDIIVKLMKHLESHGSKEEICRVYLRYIMHLYYKYDYDNLRKLLKTRQKKELQQEAKRQEEELKATEEDANKADDGESKEAEGEQKPEETSQKIEDVVNGKIEDVVNGEEKKDESKETAKTDPENEEQEEDEEKGDTLDPEENTTDLIDRMCKYIYTTDSTDIIRTRAMLCHIYHHALHDRWYKARDLIMMSHLQNNIQHSDIPTQIQYNRTLAQLGLCAFRQGSVKDAHNALLDLQSGGRAKELLAQGILIQRQQERDHQQEKIDKSRHMPFHMHINLELLECVYLVSAMLLEIPYMASHHFDIRRRMISKSFHHQLRLSERQALVGPPESMREHVVAASKAMRYGDWRLCRQHLINEKMNAKVWNLFHNADKVKALITRKIQEESLRTYLFTYGSVYDSISLNVLADMFELEKPVVHSIVSKMIINEELLASWDEPASTIVIHRCEPTKLQNLALRLADKVSNLVENNERLLDFRQDRNWKQTDNRQHYGKDRGGYQNRDRGGYQNRDRGGYQNRDRGGYQNRDRGGYQNKGRGGYNNRGGGNKGRYRNDGDRGGRYDRGRDQDQGGNRRGPRY